MHKCDFLIVGSGLAGLYCAIELAQTKSNKKITIVTKQTTLSGNTTLAQGGIAVPNSSTDKNAHYSDTILAGDGLCNKKAVRMLVNNADFHFKKLLGYGFSPDKTLSGLFDLAREGGHTEQRIYHTKDFTGKTIHELLLQQALHYKNITIVENVFAVDLLLTPNKQECAGLLVLERARSKFVNYLADATILATGGIGQLYANTTNHSTATGDGLAMALRAGVKTENLSFVQFHPTVYVPNTINAGNSFLITEALRGQGAIIKNKDGVQFLDKYDPRAELATRDIVSRAITLEQRKTKTDRVYLDCSTIQNRKLSQHFPLLAENCKKAKIKAPFNNIPITPAAHYFCGGIKTNTNGVTSLSRLFSCGETASTGLHGANRLASNSLTEALVFAANCAKKVAKVKPQETELFTTVLTNILSEPLATPKVKYYKHKLQRIMQHSLSCYTSNFKIKTALKQIEAVDSEINSKLFCESVPHLELRNILAASKAITIAYQKQKTNMGCYYNVSNTTTLGKSMTNGKPNYD